MSAKKKAFVIVVFSLLGAALIFVCWQLFSVRSIIVEGSASKDYILSICGIEKGQSIFFADTKGAYDAIEEEAWLRPIEVKKEYPDKIRITADQREIAAYVEHGDVLLAVDEECVVLRAEQAGKVPLPVITGLKADVFEVGKTIGCADKFLLDVSKKVIAELEGSELDVVKIDVSFAANIVLETRQGMRIELGDDMQLDAKLKLALATIDELAARGDTAGILDVSAVTSAYYREN